MAQLKLAGSSGALDNINASQAQFRAQIAALNDLMRQIAGSAAVSAGSAEMVDPLSAPFTLYVNPYTGSDKFVGGSYNTHEATGTDEEIIAAKLKRLELQRLECGYTPHRPFKTINRAVIEAAIITSKNWYTYTDPRAHVDCVSIVLAPGVHTVYNDPGSSNTSLASWESTKEPTVADLIAFNPATVGGVLLPRGCSLCGPDLRKTTLRPTWVPSTQGSAADEANDYSNRRGILKITGTGYFFGFTVMDAVGITSSHHLLDAFHFASKAELDAFYAKCLSTVGSPANLSTTLTTTRNTEFKIVGPIVPGESPTEAWDTTASASPYIFNCSIRSDYGLGGAFMDGSKVQGLKSMVCANFTGVSLQKDMNCWQRYAGNAWTSTTYDQYITASPNDIRMNPTRMSRHISAINDAFIQEVSVFAIGQGIHHFTDLGGEITVTNSNSSFGGCAAISKGYKSYAFPQDKNWNIARIKVPLDLSTKTGNIQRIQLGTISNITASKITLEEPLAVDSSSSTVPATLLSKGYSLKTDTYIWIENPFGDPWKATLTTTAWSSTNPDEINISGLDSSALEEITLIDDAGSVKAAIGKRIYIRRLVDTRTPSERQISLILQNTSTINRIPERNFVLQTTTGASISSSIANSSANTLTISNAGTSTLSGVSGTIAEVTLRRASATRTYTNNTYYRAGNVVRFNGKHYIAKSAHTTNASTPSASFWEETYVHMPSAYDPEDALVNEKLILLIDTDTDSDPVSTTLGINWTSSDITQQYRSSTDYLGVFRLLQILGFTDSDAHTALSPRTETARLRDPSSALVFPTQPSGGVASARGNWTLEFRRPSVLRLYGHAWEWAGFLNYSKAIPAAQKTLSPQNKFTYYFTNDSGGRVVPQGSNEEGFNITPRGIEDIETGTTLSVENLGSSSIEQRAAISYQALSVKDLTIENNGKITLEGNASIVGLDTVLATTTNPGTAKLAPANAMALPPGQGPIISGSSNTALNASIEANVSSPNDGLITLSSLNYWRIQQGLVSANTSNVSIYVHPSGNGGTTLTQMLSNPPTVNSLSAAVRTVQLAAQYANYLLNGSEQTAVICIAPGLYDPMSTWNCNVRFESWKSDLTGRLNQSNYSGSNFGQTLAANNYFQGYDSLGSGYDNLTTGVNFWAFSLALNTSQTTQLAVVVNGRTMTFNKSVVFRGGFNFLGLDRIIPKVASNQISRASFLENSTLTTTNTGEWSGTWSSNFTTNLDTLLSKIRANDRPSATDYIGIGGDPLLYIKSPTNYTVQIRDIVFGPGLPVRKEASGAQRHALISAFGTAALEIANIYIRGFSQITAAGIGVTEALSESGQSHYSDTAITGSWTWRQTFHTFLGTPMDSGDSLNIKSLGDTKWVLTSSSPSSRTYFKDLTNRYLPNSIHLLNNSGAEASATDGPFFDQFIHAKVGIFIQSAWEEVNSSAATTSPFAGFVGFFGNAGTSTAKTRGVLLGNYGRHDPEVGFMVNWGSVPERSFSAATYGATTYPAGTAGSIFQKTGQTVANEANGRPAFINGPQLYGEAIPEGTTPAGTNRKDNAIMPVTANATFTQTVNTYSITGSYETYGAAANTSLLNVGLRHWRAGISSSKGTIVSKYIVM